MIRDTFLMFVDIKKGVQSNKLYNMYPSKDGTSFTIEYGRVGNKNLATHTYDDMSKWSSLYNSKIRKGYKDITDLKMDTVITEDSSGNNAFDEFYEKFSTYAKIVVQNTYVSDGCTQAQINEAQNVINLISKTRKKSDINDLFLELYKVIPRKMKNVDDFLIKKIKDKQPFLQREQNALDSMNSSNIIHTTSPYKELGVDFSEVVDISAMEKLLYPTMGGRRGNIATIHKVYAIKDMVTEKRFQDWLKVQDNKKTELLIHGTRNANVFGILKSGLLIRPAGAIISGAIYGNGIYHSAHSAKSLGYTGYDNDKLFLIQNVHMGNPYTYNGWYRDGKDLSRDEMNYKDLKKNGYDSLFVKAGDGLLDSEYIVYNSDQTTTNFLVWMKK